jgi:anti-sigma B factor antagonist
MKLSIEEQKTTERAELRLAGSMNIHTAMALRKRLKALLNDEVNEIRVDMRGVEFIDSAGIAVLVEGLQWSRKKEGRRFVLVGLSENVRDIFELAKLDTVFDIEEAAAA